MRFLKPTYAKGLDSDVYTMIELYNNKNNLLLELPFPIIQGTHLSCLEPARYTMEVECMLKTMQPWKSTQNKTNIKILEATKSKLKFSKQSVSTLIISSEVVN